MKLLLLLFFAFPVQEEKRIEAERLIHLSEQETKKSERDRYLAEAWALRSEAFMEAGNARASKEAWVRAQAYGWSGPDPSGGDSFGGQDELPEPLEFPSGIKKPFTPQPKTDWEKFTLQPFRSARNSAGHGLIHLPSLEEAVTYPAGTWHAEANMGITPVSLSVGNSRWEVTRLEAMFGADYAPFDFLQVGMKVITAELRQRGDQPLVLFENGYQIIPTGTRSPSVAAIVLRGKMAWDEIFMGFSVGVLGEIKIPVEDQQSYLSSGTIDFSVAGLLTKHITEDLALHANLGFVMPFGDAGLFLDNGDFSFLPETNELSTVISFTAGGAYRILPRFTAGAQIEYNSSPFQNVSVFDEASTMFVVFGRGEMDHYAFFSFALGTGFGDVGADFYLSLSFDFTL